MRAVAQAILFGLLVIAVVFGAARALASPECDKQRDACRTACFDKSAKDPAAFAKCKEDCNRAWLACGGK